VTAAGSSYKGFRFAPEVISHCVWLYHRFPLSFRGHRQVVGLVWYRQDWSVAVGATYKGYRYPIEVIGHAVWLYHRFALSLRDVEELLLARGVMLTYETIRSWCATFGPDYANQLRRRRPRPGDKWHLDEVFVKINGTTHYRWRA
jgi:transposase-like protein